MHYYGEQPPLTINPTEADIEHTNPPPITLGRDGCIYTSFGLLASHALHVEKKGKKGDAYSILSWLLYIFNDVCILESNNRETFN